MSNLLMIAIGAAVMASVMIVLYIVQRRTGDAGIVDVAWAGGVGLLTVFYAFVGKGLPERRFLVALMTGLWSLRLAVYIFRDRVLSGPEDGRYGALRESWGDRFESRIFWFFQAQGLLAFLFSLPPLLALTSPRLELGLLDVAAVVLWLAAVGGETLADRQLATFRADPANRGRTCRSGLWRTSRHPNYFFEWLHWWAYALAAAASPLWWVAAGAPLVMLVFILFVTGIPPTEARALLSRGDDYRNYQRTTSAFVPWFPKRGSI